MSDKQRGGFPTGDSLLADMFGVNENDRAEWERQRDIRRDKAKKGGPLHAMFKLAEVGITAHMHGAYMEAERGTQEKRMTERTVYTKSENVDEIQEPRKTVDTDGYSF